MKKADCIFCMIANGDIPARTVYEDDGFRVILDMGPATKGHALVLPKEHYADLFEITAEDAKAAMDVARKTAAVLKEKLGADGLNIVQNNGEAAGQTVSHFHIHLIPRYHNDGQLIGWKPASPSAEELDAVLEEIVK